MTALLLVTDLLLKMIQVKRLCLFVLLFLLLFTQVCGLFLDLVIHLLKKKWNQFMQVFVKSTTQKQRLIIKLNKLNIKIKHLRRGAFCLEIRVCRDNKL